MLVCARRGASSGAAIGAALTAASIGAAWLPCRPVWSTSRGAATTSRRKTSEAAATADSADGKAAKPVKVAAVARPARTRKTSSTGATRSRASSAASKKAIDDKPVWPPLAQSVLADMAGFPDCVLLTRVGGFYESYFHQAPQLASMLGIKLATRRWGGQDVHMAGFPIFQLEKYLKTLVVDKGLLVAISEEYRSPTLHNEKPDIQRRVQRVVSAGTLMDEKFVDPFRNNFIVSVSRVALADATGIALAQGAGQDGRQDQDQDAFGFGLAWLDIGTADFSTTACRDLESLRDELARLSPREIILEPRLYGRANSLIDGGEMVVEGSAETRVGDSGTGQTAGRDSPLEEVLTVVDSHISRFDLGDDRDALVPASAWEGEAEGGAVKTLLGYLRTRLLDHDAEIDALTTARPIRLQRDDAMQIDAHTLAALEVKEVIREGGIKGSLFSVMRRTVSKGGTRLLQQWLAMPSTSLSVIEARLDLVELFLKRPFLREDLRSVLRLGAGDISRVLQRLITRRNNEQDLLEVRDFVQACDRIVAKLRQEEQFESDPDRRAELAPLMALADKFRVLTALGVRLGEAIDERVIEHRLRRQEEMARSLESEVAGSEVNGTADAGSLGGAGVGMEATKKRTAAAAKADSPDGEPSEAELWGENFEHLIRPSTSKTLTLMTKSLEKLRRDARKLEAELKDTHGDHITLRYVLGQGFVVHARGKAANDAGRGLHVAGKLRSTHTYYSERWTLLGGKVHKLMKEMKDIEAQELEQLRQDALVELSSLRWNAKLLDQLDALAGYSQAAQELNLVRPRVDDSHDFDVRGGRHLSVEMGLLEHHRLFSANDLHLTRSSFLHLITGPNMGGKSTFLRQNAMIAILAQAGSFVPAASARVGIVDRVFSRVGAKDDLFRDRSTFMVEMMETSEILRRATERSLVIADEIGRGTTTEVGLAVAFATLHHLYTTNRCRTLFATHFHEVADMLGYREGVDGAASTGSAEGSRFKAVGFFCTDVTESGDGSITYSHHIRPGVNRESHGLKVAKLAEMPQPALEVAASTLEWLRRRREDAGGVAAQQQQQQQQQQSQDYGGKGEADEYADLYARLDGLSL